MGLPNDAIRESIPIDYSTSIPLSARLCLLLRRIVFSAAIVSYALALITITLIFFYSAGWTETTGNRVGAAIFLFEVAILMFFILVLGSQRWRRGNRWGWHWLWDDAGEEDVEGKIRGDGWGMRGV